MEGVNEKFLEKYLKEKSLVLLDLSYAYNVVSVKDMAYLGGLTQDANQLLFLIGTILNRIEKQKKHLSQEYKFGLMKFFSKKQKRLNELNSQAFLLESIGLFLQQFSTMENFLETRWGNFTTKGEVLYTKYALRKDHLKDTRNMFVQLSNANFDKTSYYMVIFDSFYFDNLGKFKDTSVVYTWQNEEIFTVQKEQKFELFRHKDEFLQTIHQELIKLSYDENPLKLPFFGVRIIKSKGKPKPVPPSKNNVVEFRDYQQKINSLLDQERKKAA